MVDEENEVTENGNGEEAVAPESAENGKDEKTEEKTEEKEPTEEVTSAEEVINGDSTGKLNKSFIPISIHSV